MRQEKFDGGMKDRKKTWYNTMWVGKITNALPRGSIRGRVDGGGIVKK